MDKEYSNEISRNAENVKEDSLNTLKKRRLDLGMDEKTAAFKARLSPSTYSKLERGKTALRNISLENGIKLSRALKCKPEDLVEVEKITDEEYLEKLRIEQERKLSKIRQTDPSKYERLIKEKREREEREKEAERRRNILAQIEKQQKKAREEAEKLRELKKELKNK